MGVDFVEFEHLLGGDEDLPLFVVVGGLEELLLEHLLRVLGPLEAVEVVDQLGAHLLLLGGALLGGLEVHVPQYAAEPVLLLAPEELLHLGHVVLYLPALFLDLQLLHPLPGCFFDLPQLGEVLFHLDDLLEDVLVV